MSVSDRPTASASRSLTEVFVTYVREILAPQLWRGAFVIMDNFPVHKAKTIQEIIITTVGAKVIFLPPYSPDL